MTLRESARAVFDAALRTGDVRPLVQRALANQARLIRLPVHVEAQLGKVRRTQERLAQERGRPPEMAARGGALPD